MVSDYYCCIYLFIFIFSGQRQQSVDQFLSRLPQSVIKEGKIIDVRAGVANVIKVRTVVQLVCEFILVVSI